MRRFFGVVLLVLGVPVIAAGVVMAVYVGPDDTFGVLDEEISTDTAVITSTPSVLDISGPTLHVSADAGDAGTFVGVAHPVHAQSYLQDVSVERITAAGWREDLAHESAAGEEDVPATSPGELDWWRGSSVGTGEQTVSVELTDEPTQVVVTAADPEAPLAVDLTVDAEIDGLFATALLATGLGLILVAGGVVLLGTARRHRRAGRRTTGTGKPPDPAADAPGDAETVGPPPPPESPGRSARMSLLAGIGTGSVLVLAGCAELPGDADGEAHTAVAAVTPQAADDFFAYYTETNNTANAEQDPELIATVETGPLLTSSQMSYQVQQAQDRDPIEPFTVAPQHIAGPEFDAYPMWFVALAEPESEEAGPAYYLVTREDAASPWQAELSVYPPNDAEPVRPVIDDGTAAIADEDSAARGEEVLEAVVAYAETGEEPDGVDLSGGGGLASLPEQGIEITEGPQDRVTAERDCSLHGDDVRWLASESGAMALAAVSCTQDVTLDEDYTITLDGDGYGTIPGDTRLTEMTITHGVSFVVEVDDDGSATVSGEAMLPYAMDYAEEE
ncbi:hypothetical protein [Phytoactinopolyspora endophytica]|uniref:hypothetical protein n=1 Tax=Phytoactinopolyspora endophytica TaxID=1642495 RepID=UPI00101BC672|nr:hypothetical protein [Phytoactinopolyspora endophytica]